MEMWDHQLRGVKATLNAIDQGERKILVASPTGGGKTKMALMLAEEFLKRDMKVVYYTNRRLLVDQTSRVLAAAGYEHGIRAAGYEDERQHNLQVSSMQTEHSRVTRAGKWELHEASLVLCDEAHLQAGPMARKILEAHSEAGAVYVGFTATPLDLAGLYGKLIVAGVNSELRKCGALVAARHFGCDEPDLRKIKAPLGEDLTEKQNREAMIRPGLFGRVLKWFRELNPGQSPTLLFAPGVPESVWFAQEFTKAGIRTAHIDGEEVWLDGEFERSSRGLRQNVLEQHRRGEIKVVCNRFVLREGVDAPWIEHLILATVLGSLQTYLQTVGRGLRASPETGKDRVVIQDHGGAWWRHGSANADREWTLELTSSMATGLREERLREKKEREPVRCPECAGIVVGLQCRSCGYELPPGRKSRPVVQSDGTLTEMAGDIFRPRRLCQQPNGPAIWERMFWRSRTEKGKKTFRQAAALFAAENHWGWPSKTWPMMPLEEGDWYRFVGDVPIERLVPKPGK